MAPSATGPGDTTTIGPTVRIRGRVTGTADLEIEGFVEGEVTLEGELTIGESGRVGANVRARTVIVRGAIRGDVQADDVVRLEAGARVVGDVRAPRVSIAPGAKVRGFVQTAGSGGAAPARAAAAARTTATRTEPRPAAAAAPNAASASTASSANHRAAAAPAASAPASAPTASKQAPAPTPTIKQAATPVHLAGGARSGPPAPVVPVIKKAKGQLTKKRGE